MDGPDTTFAGYHVRRNVLRTALLSMYEATAPGGVQTPGNGVASSVTRPVALWISEPFDQQAADAVSEFMRRIELSTSIDHPALVEVLDVGRAHGRVYFATPPLQAITFDEMMRHEGPLEPDDAVGLLGDLAAGLDAAHAAGLVHGAISPTTLWVESPAEADRRARVVGFGLEALLRAQAQGARHERLLDEVLYIAPERLRGDDSPDGRADQYALACALYHCVSGHPPFVRDRMSALFGAHMLARPEPLMNGDGNHAFGDAVATGMAKDAEQRFATCTALLEHAAGGPLSLSAPAPARDAGPQSPPAHDAGDQAPPAPARAPVATPAAAGPSARGDRVPLVARPASQPATAPPAPPADAPRGRRARRSRDLMPWVVIGLVLLAVVAGAALSLVVLGGPAADDADGQAAAQDQDGGAEAPAGQEDAAVAPARREPDSAATVATGGTGTVVWQRDIGDDPVTELSVEGTSAVAATGNDLTVVNPLTGSRRWRKVADVGVLNELVTVGDVVVYRTDVLAGVSLLFGTQLWENPEADTPTGGLGTGSGFVYAVGTGGGEPALLAFDPGDGQERWHFHGTEVAIAADAMVSASGNLAVALQRDALLGIDAERSAVHAQGAGPEGEAWRVDDLGAAWPESLRVSEDDVVFALQEGDVCAHDLDGGERRWCAQVRGARDGVPGLALRDDTAVVVTPAAVVALDLADGDERWRIDADEARFLPLVAVDGEIVAVPDEAGTLHTYAGDSGAPAWQVRDIGEISALAASDGGMVVGTDEGVLARVERGGS